MKKAFYLVIVLTVIIISIVTSYKLFYKKTIPNQGAVPCSEEFHNAINTENVSLCEVVKENGGYKNPYYDNECREWCIQEVAYVKGDPNLCKLIKKFNDIPPTTDGWGDEGNPRKTGSFIDNCYRHLAEKLDDISLCNNVETEWAKKHCP